MRCIETLHNYHSHSTDETINNNMRCIETLIPDCFLDNIDDK